MRSVKAKRRCERLRHEGKVGHITPKITAEKIVAEGSCYWTEIAAYAEMILR